MDRLIKPVIFEKTFPEFKLTIGIKKIGYGEFQDISIGFAAILKGISPDVSNQLLGAVQKANVEEANAAAVALPGDILGKMAQMGKRMILAGVDSILVDDQKKGPVEQVYDQLDKGMVDWINEKVHEVNADLFRSKKN
jgi:hypothetical protein